MTSIVSRAELVKLSVLEGADPAAIARLLDCRILPEREEITEPQNSAPPPTNVRQIDKNDAEVDARDVAAVPLWQPVSVQYAEARSRPRRSMRPLSVAELSSHQEVAAPEILPLLPWSRHRTTIASTLATTHVGEVDADRLVDDFSRGEVAPTIPRRRRQLRARCCVALDRSPRLTQFRGDQDALVRRIQAEHAGWADVLHLPRGADGPALRSGRAVGKELGADLVRGPLLVISDLGAYGEPNRENEWLRAGRKLERAGVAPRALVPCPLDRLSTELTALWQVYSWDRGSGAVHQGVAKLLPLLGPAVFVEPGLLRAVRLLLSAEDVDVGTEMQVWALARAASTRAMELPSDLRLTALQQFEELPLDLRRSVLALLRQWHAERWPSIWYEEVLGVAPDHAAADALRISEDWRTANEYVRRLAPTIASRRFAGDQQERLVSYCARLVDRLPSDDASTAHLKRTRDALRLEIAHHRPSSTVSANTEIPPDDVEPRWVQIRSLEDRLELRESESSDTRGSAVGRLLIGAQLFESNGGEKRPVSQPEVVVGRAAERVILETGHSTVCLRAFERPDWAVAAGRDRFGLWVDSVTEGVRHRFRWIPPGKFRMGSPEGEDGRQEAEGPRHEVTISRGFWLGETPVTQALWKALRGENPSEFKSEERPVENVSWDDVQLFIGAMNKRERTDEYRLPTEAEWEYSCRADTETSTYAGELEIRGQDNGPILDGIAWYGGNSGVDFELENGFDASTWKEQQYDHDRVGSHPVKRKQPNNLGLYDMLGNVWEWCADWWADSYPGEDSRTDPSGPPEGSGRVCRGGSWIINARYCRSAARDLGSPDDRNCNLGFRLARGQCAPRQEQVSQVEEEPGRSDSAPRGAGRAHGAERDRTSDES